MVLSTKEHGQQLDVPLLSAWTKPIDGAIQSEMTKARQEIYELFYTNMNCGQAVGRGDDRLVLLALERLRDSLDTRRFALAHRARLPSDAPGGSGFAGADATKNESRKHRRGFLRESAGKGRPNSQRTPGDRPGSTQPYRMRLTGVLYFL